MPDTDPLVDADLHAAAQRYAKLHAREFGDQDSESYRRVYSPFYYAYRDAYRVGRRAGAAGVWRRIRAAAANGTTLTDPFADTNEVDPDAFGDAPGYNLPYS